MLTQNVLKTDDISGITNGTFIYCKELRKGFVKTDLTPLNLSSTTFEFVVSIIEAMGSALINSEFDSVLFGANLTPEQGQMIISERLKQKIKDIIINLPQENKNETYVTELLDNKRLEADYFDNEFVENILSTIVSSFNFDNIIKIKASDGAATDYFGQSVAIGDKIVVGAYGDDDKGSGSGSAYIYDLNGNFVKKITAPDGAASDYFGHSVAIGDKIVVGAWGDDDNGSTAGSAYIYDLNGNFVKKITAPDGEASDYFGYYVAIGDKIVVGAFSDDDKGTDSGSAYIYDLNGNFENKITADDGAASDAFAYSLDIGDKIVVGAYLDDDKGTNSGSVYIYDLNGNFVKKITADDGISNDSFGSSVAIGDKIVVGAYLDDDKGTNSGSVYIYDLNGNFVKKITAPDGAENDYFGYSVAIGSKIVVGVFADDDKGTDSGSVYIYDLDGNFENKITAPDGAASDFFGFSVAIGDKIVAGAKYDDDKGASSGSVYIIG